MILMKNMGLFSECFVKNVHIYMKLNKFMLRKVFVNIMTVKQNYYTQCLY